MMTRFIPGLLSVRKSIKAKFFVTCMLVTILSILIVSASIYMNADISIRSNVSSLVTSSMENSNHNMEIAFKEINDILTAVLLNKDMIHDAFFSPNQPVSLEWFQEKKRVEGFLENLVVNKSQIVRIVIACPDGKMFSYGREIDQKALFSQPWVQRIVAGQGAVTIFARESDPVLDEPVVTIGRAVVVEGRVAGVICADLRGSVLREIFSLGARTDSLLIVADSDGTTAYRSSRTLGGHAISADELRLIAGRARTAPPQTLKIGGEKVMMVMYHSEMSGWNTLGLIPEKSLFRESDTLFRQMVVLVVFIIAMIFFVTAAVTGRITRNIRRLADAMKTVNEDNLDIQLPISSQDEIGLLEKRFVSMMSRIGNLLEDIKSRERQKRTTELKILQAQISPHFLYNTLNTIGRMARIQNVPNIEEVSVALISLLRGIARNQDELVTIREEIRMIDSYLKIQQYRLMTPFSVVYDIEPEAEVCGTLKLLIQPIVENAVLHGIEGVEHEGLIAIRIGTEGDELLISVTDNGVGMSQAQAEQVLSGTDHDKKRLSGIGLGNVHERIRLFFGEAYGLNIYSQEGLYTTVEVRLPRVTPEEARHA